MEELFLIGLLVFYVLRAIAGKKKQAPPPDGSTEGPGAELDDALAEIREALGMGKAPPAPEPPVSQPRTPLVAKPAQPKPTPATSDEFHRVVTGRPDADRAFDRQPSEWKVPVRSKSEDFFESQRSEWNTPTAPRTEDRFERKKGEFVDPLIGHDHIDRDAPTATTSRRRLHRFETPDSLREAIIAAEILGPPKALRGRRQR